VHDQPVVFAVESGSGYTERISLRTSTEGYVSTRWIPGKIGTNTASATWGGTTVSFTAQGTAATGQRIVEVMGNEQTMRVAPIFYSTVTSAPVGVRVVHGGGDPVAGATVDWQSPHASGTTTTDETGWTTFTPKFDNSSPGARHVTATLANGATANLVVVFLPSGANVSGGVLHPPTSGIAGRRLEEPIVVVCQDRQGGPSTACSVGVSGANFSDPGGLLFPVPGYPLPGQQRFYWVLPDTPGTYRFTVYAPAGPNSIQVTATPP
jgi:hypothetical protein